MPPLGEPLHYEEYQRRLARQPEGLKVQPEGLVNAETAEVKAVGKGSEDAVAIVFAAG